MPGGQPPLLKYFVVFPPTAGKGHISGTPYHDVLPAEAMFN
jgi:hypothetical protein